MRSSFPKQKQYNRERRQSLSIHIESFEDELRSELSLCFNNVHNLLHEKQKIGILTNSHKHQIISNILLKTCSISQ